MAKKKKKDDEDDIEFTPDEEEAAPQAKAEEDEEAEIDLDAAEEEDADKEMELEAADEEEAGEEKGGEDEDQEANLDVEDEDQEAELEEEEGEEEEEEEEEKDEEEVELPPRPRTPIFTIILLILNFLVAPIFVLALYMDYAARNQWSYATLANRVVAWGLPLEDDAKGPGITLTSRPRLRLDNDKLKSPRIKGSGEFEPVETVEEPIESVILPSQIDANIQHDLFKQNGLDDPVTTLEDEVNRLRGKVPGWIDAAADKVAASADNNLKKETAIRNILLPLATTTKQVEELATRLDDAKAKGPAELDKLLTEAAKRRMLADILAPLDVYRPGDVNEHTVENICEQKLEVLDALLVMRIVQTIRPDNSPSVHLGESLNKPGSQRDDIEKRHSIAFLLVTLSRVKVPESKEMLVPKGFERAQVVSGSFEFAIAVTNYARTLPVLEQRILAAIIADREGYLVKRDQEIEDELKAYRNPVVGGFAAAHADYITLMKKTAAEIEFTKRRLGEVAKEAKRFQDVYDARAKLLTEVNMQLLAARKKTADERELLRAKEQELFDALRDLSDAADRNFRLERRIVEAEGVLLPKKGKS